MVLAGHVATSVRTPSLSEVRHSNWTLSRYVTIRLDPHDPSRTMTCLVFGDPASVGQTLDVTSAPSRLSWLEMARSIFTPLEILNIHRLPVEIRLLLFYHCLSHCHQERHTPPLIKALRSHPELYHEALEVFYSLKLCSTPRFGERAKSIPESVVSRARSLRVWWRPEFLDERQDKHHRMRCNLFDLPLDSVPSLRSHVRSLYIANDFVYFPRSEKRQSLVELVRAAIVYLPALRTLTIELNFNQCDVVESGARCLPSPTFAIDNATGITHRWSERPIDRGSFDNIAVTWDAKSHRNLTWTDCRYWHSILWSHIGLMFTVLTRSHMIGFCPTTKHSYNLGLGRLRNGPRQIHCGNPDCQTLVTLEDANLGFCPSGWSDHRPWKEPDITDPRLLEARKLFEIPTSFHPVLHPRYTRQILPD